MLGSSKASSTRPFSNVNSSSRLTPKSAEKTCRNAKDSLLVSRPTANTTINCGVGIVLGGDDDTIIVKELVDGSPAQRSLLKKLHWIRIEKSCMFEPQLQFRNPALQEWCNRDSIHIDRS